MTAKPDAAHVSRLRDIVSERLGLAIGNDKLPELAKVMQRQLASSGASPDAFLGRLASASGEHELWALAPALTVPESYFFRNAAQFAALRDIVVPERVRALGGVRRLRALSAGCAHGEEAYTLSMVLLGALAGTGAEFSVTGADVNPRCIERARLASYTRWAMREVTAEQCQRWFVRIGDQFTVVPPVREHVGFVQANLVRDDASIWENLGYDVVFCRNVLMYLTPEHARRVVERIARSLAPGGYLFLGHAEGLRDVSDQFELCHTHGTFYYRRGEGRSDRRAAPIDALPQSSTRLAEFQGSGEGAAWVDAIGGAWSRVRALTAEPSGGVAREPDSQAVLDLVTEELRAERYVEALAHLDSLPASVAAQPDVQLVHAVLLLHNGRMKEARAMCELLLRREQHRAEAHYLLAQYQESSGDVAQASHEDRQAVRHDPTFGMPRLHLGLLASRRGDLAEARRELARAEALLTRESATRLLLFGGGFSRATLVALCRAELARCEERT